MAIRRLRRNPTRRRRSGTLIANPRRKRRNPRRRRRVARRNPRRRIKRSNPRRRVARRRNPARRVTRRVTRRNPTRRYARRRNAGLTLAGIPVMEAALGGLGALVVINAAKNIGPIKTQLDKITSKPLRAALPPAIAAAAGWALHKYGKGAMVKGVAKFVVAASLFKLVDDVTDEYFKDEFPKLFGDSTDTTGAYMPLSGHTRGAYLPVSGGHSAGAYVPVSGTRGYGTFGLL